MLKLLVGMLLVFGTLTVLMAHGPITAPLPAPETDPSTGMAAMALVTGAALIIRGRRTRE